MVLLAALQIRNKKVNPRAGTRSSLREEGRTIAVVRARNPPLLHAPFDPEMPPSPRLRRLLFCVFGVSNPEICRAAWFAL